MKILINSIYVKHTEVTTYGEEEPRYIKSHVEVDYTVIKGRNKLSGELLIREDIDNLTLIQIEKMVSERVVELLEKEVK